MHFISWGISVKLSIYAHRQTEKFRLFRDRFSAIKAVDLSLVAIHQVATARRRLWYLFRVQVKLPPTHLSTTHDGEQRTVSSYS